MMPHPERAFLNSQLSWTNLKGEGFSPWIKMFINARKYF
jgi:phosphoribosylformylglycinamidine (FGAM) synthase-like amidotransferase family enzyme